MTVSTRSKFTSALLAGTLALGMVPAVGLTVATEPVFDSSAVAMAATEGTAENITFTVTESAHGIVAIGGDYKFDTPQNVFLGAPLQIQIIPAEGYEIDTMQLSITPEADPIPVVTGSDFVEGEDGTYTYTWTDSPTLLTGNQTVNIAVSYTEIEEEQPPAVITYNVSASPEIKNAKLTFTSGEDTDATLDVPAGEQVTINVIPTGAYKVQSVALYNANGFMIGVEPVDGVYSFTMPAEDVMVDVSMTAMDIKYWYDVTVNDWFFGAVTKADSLGYMTGYGNHTFGPEDSVTRGQVAVVLQRMAGVNGYTGSNPFVDINMNDEFYYNQPVVWAYNNGIVAGMYDRNGSLIFDPDGDATREQFVVMVSRYAQKFNKEELLPDYLAYKYLKDQGYPDVDEISEWALPSMAWAVENGVIQGSTEKGSTTLKLLPKNTITRAEVAQIAVNYQPNGPLA